ncbi:hypothetical protein V5799_017695 [Amblyomma americanum]|uniref:Uncharacterized protein n=1 Tax=Amblyomma americanum TaxID=6943 RepID=A0AAQ4F1D7_AMBAM
MDTRNLCDMFLNSEGWNWGRHSMTTLTAIGVLLSKLLQLTTHEAVHDLFSNFTWTSSDLGVDEHMVVNHWGTTKGRVFLTLGLFIFMNLWMTALAATIPVPLGLFIPVFKMGTTKPTVPMEQFFAVGCLCGP